MIYFSLISVERVIRELNFGVQNFLVQPSFTNQLKVEIVFVTEKVEQLPSFVTKNFSSVVAENVKTFLHHMIIVFVIFKTFIRGPTVRHGEAFFPHSSMPRIKVSAVLSGTATRNTSSVSRHTPPNTHCEG